MKTQTFTASISQEEDLFIAQCLEIDIASQGKSEDEAIENLKEALALYFEPPRPTVIPKLRKFEVSVGADEAAVLFSHIFSEIKALQSSRRPVK